MEESEVRDEEGTEENEAETWQETCRKILAKERIGLDDMTELTHVDDHTIAENLRIRLVEEQIYTCIGRVLIAVNPFKKLNIYDKSYVAAYHYFLEMKQTKKRTQTLNHEDALKCSTARLPSLIQCDNTNNEQNPGVELPPHIYALTDNMYRNMMIESENQCVIISGESGAGKTISAKYIMSYLSEVASGGTQKIEEIKNIIIQSNPLLEAFGNAKTLRNNNSSRFGKFVEILFNMSGQPDGGRISNFLLEKSRVVSQNPGERNYHVFYQLLRGCSEDQAESLGLQHSDPAEYYYLNRTGGVYDVPDADDMEEFHATMNAMSVVGLPPERQNNVLEIISAILHLGNIQFIEDNNVSEVENPTDLVIPAQLLGVDKDALKEKLVSRMMEARWGGKVDIMMMTLNIEQASISRDALAKALYAQLFDFLVTIINSAMHKEKIELCIGVLDIYGFEIFETNGFEQFCINFVNEKLQQIFVELTLKSEQEEYLEEGITWTPVKFFNNKLVCDLIESKVPPGIMSVLDDVCFTVHASEGSDRTLMEKLKAVVGSETTYSRYFRGLSTHFEIHHYAGKVHYEATHFCERNKDSLFDDIIQLMQSSQNEFIQSLFSDMPTSSGRRGRSSTGSSKIKSQCQTLIDRIMACTPHYVRCLKPSETKEPLDWHDHRILPQISYLGLRENIDVRRAGFAFRRPFDKVIDRYDVVLPKDVFDGVRDDKANTCKAIMETAQFSPEIWRIGKTKVFMKESDMITQLEHLRSDALYGYAAKIQALVRGFLARQYCKKLRERIKATKTLQRAFRSYGGRKRLDYRLSVKQCLKIVIDYLITENAKPTEGTAHDESNEISESKEINYSDVPNEESNEISESTEINYSDVQNEESNEISESTEMNYSDVPNEESNEISESMEITDSDVPKEGLNEISESTEINYSDVTNEESNEISESMEITDSDVPKEPTPCIFTHEEIVDHVGYYFNKTLQNMTGDRSIFFSCHGKVFGKNRKMENQIVVLSLHNLYTISGEESSGIGYTLVHKLDYTEVQGFYVSILDTDFLVLKMQSFDIILDTIHKNSLIAFLMAIVNVVKQVWLPYEKSDVIAINSESGQQVSLKFIIEGRKNYTEPSISSSGNEIVVVLPNMEEAEEVFEDVEELNTEQTKFQETEMQDVEEPHSAELNTEQTEWQGTEILGAEEGQHEVTGNQEFQQNFEDQIPTIQKRESNFCLKMVFGKCGGRVSCKGFDVIITESRSESCCETQPISLKILYELPSASYRKPDEILLSPFIMVGNMSEDVSELRLTLPFLRDLPEDTDSMAKWIRFYGAPSGNDTPVWRDIRTAYEMGAFMVEIRKDHAKLCTQQNVTFCIMGSRIEPAVVYDYDAGLEEENYGAQYNYNFEEYASYYGDYGAENYGENCYNESNDFGNIPVGKVKTSAENNNTPDNFSLASMGVQKALENPIPRPALGLPPEPPTKPPPSKPSSSTFDDAPVKIETRKKFKVKKVWKTTKSKKKDK